VAARDQAVVPRPLSFEQVLEVVYGAAEGVLERLVPAFAVAKALPILEQRPYPGTVDE
jgi:hypothetical protein